MNIAYIVPSLRKLGPVVVTYDLVCRMIDEGHRVTVYFFDNYTDNTICFPCPTIRIKIWEKFKFEEYDIVHSHCFRSDFYVFIHKPLGGTKTKFITTIHNFVFEDLSSQYNKFISSILGNLWILSVKRHNQIVVLSNVAKEYYKRWFNSKNLHVIYNTRSLQEKHDLSNEEIEQLMDFKTNCSLIGINALLTQRKGIDLAIKALPYIDNVKLYIVGDGKIKTELKQLSEKLGISKRVFFAGFKEDAYRYIKYYDLYLMPSRSEGFPLALLEAVSLQCNIVVSDIPIFREFFTDSEATFFELENNQSLVSAIEYALTHDKSKMAYKRYLSDYTIDKFAQSYLNIYKTVLG